MSLDINYILFIRFHCPIGCVINIQSFFVAVVEPASRLSGPFSIATTTVPELSRVTNFFLLHKCLK